MWIAALRSGFALLPLLHPATVEQHWRVPQQPQMAAAAAEEDPTASEPSRWFIEVPSTFQQVAKQASRSASSAFSQTRRIVIEAATPELDPASANYKPEELVAFARDVAEECLLGKSPMLLPTSKPHVKILFGSTAEATMAGAAILTTEVPVSVLGYSTAVGPRDGAFVVVAPMLRGGDIDAQAALNALLQEAGNRPVVLINPRLGNSPMLATFETAYLFRPLSLAYLADQYSKQIDRVAACVLRCHPHEYGVLFDAAGKSADRSDWVYAGRSAAPPQPKQLEELLQSALTAKRNAQFRGV